MNLDFIRGVQIVIIAFLSYTITVTFTGWFESFIAKKMGDDTPEQLGFLSFNPLDHFNIFGFAAVLWDAFYGHLFALRIIPAWGRHIPLLPDTMSGKNLRLRAFIEFLGRAFGNLIILITVAFTSAVIFKTYILDSSQFMPSSIYSLQQLFIFLYRQNLTLFVLHVVLGLFKYIIHFYVPRLQMVSLQRILIGFVILTLSIFILAPLLESFVNLLSGLVFLAILR